MHRSTQDTVRIVETEVFGTRLHDALKEAKKKLKATRKVYRTLRLLGGLSLLSPALLLFAAQYLSNPILSAFFDPPVKGGTSPQVLISIYGVLLGFVAFTAAAIKRVDLISLHQDEEELEFEIDLDREQVRPEQRRAEKYLWHYKRQLRRYHDLNLKQNVTNSAIGLSAIVLGILIAVAAAYIAIYAVSTKEARIIVAILGGNSSVLLTYLAAIYVKMHAATPAARNFNSSSLEIQQMLLGDLMASQIENPQIRERTISKIALNLAALHGDLSPQSQDGLSKRGSRSNKNSGKADNQSAPGTAAERELKSSSATA
jgi:hypothetical protein